MNTCQNQYWMRNATKGYIQDTTLYTLKWNRNAVRIKICKEKYKNMHGNTTHAYKRQIITTWGVKGRINIDESRTKPISLSEILFKWDLKQIL